MLLVNECLMLRAYISLWLSPETFGYTLVYRTVWRVKLSLCFNWAPCREDALGEWRYSSTHSLTSALDGGEWSASRPGRFTPKERTPGTHWVGGWVGPRAVLDAVVKRKFPSLHRESNPRTPIVQPVAQRYTDWAITAPHIGLCIKCKFALWKISFASWAVPRYNYKQRFGGW
jgi:hypothetical protein